MLKKLAIIIVSFALPIAASAHENEKNPEVKYRHAVMESMSNQFAAMALIFQNKVNRPDEMQVLAKALAETTALIGGLFPENSQGADALPLIWEEPEQVAKAAKLSAETAATLAEVAGSGNKAEIAKALKAAGDACKSCHERYREEGDEDHDDEDHDDADR